MSRGLAIVLVAAGGCYAPTPPTGSPCRDGNCPSGLVCAAATRTCELVDRDAAIDTPLIDAPPLTGAGTPASPFVSTVPRQSCTAFLAAFPMQAGRNGTYRVQHGNGELDVYCDMTTDGGGWTLIARVAATSTSHATAAAIGAVTDPGQTATGKLADATTNQLGFTHARFAIDGVGTFFAMVSTLDMTPTEFMLPKSVSPAVAGPFTHDLLTQISCGSDCGVNVARPGLGFGNNCGYQFYAQQGTPRPGMGCEGNHTKSGSVWVR